MAKFIDLTGQKFGNLTVIRRVEDHILPSGKPRTMWLCRCKCGKLTNVSSQSLRQGTTISCGCVGKEIRRQKALQFYDDLVGQRFGKLFVLFHDTSWVVPSGQKKARFICQCDCGQIISVLANSLKNGQTRSCGCERKRITAERRLINIAGQRFGRLTVLEQAATRYYNSTSVAYWKCRCDCGSIVEVPSQRLRLGITQSCGCIESRGEEEVCKYLTSLSVTYKREYVFDDLRASSNLPLRFDFAIFDEDKLLGLVEYQGMQHYVDCGEFGYIQRTYTDKMKKAYCQNHHIALFEIRYDENVIEACDKIISALHVNTVPSSE